MHMVSDQSRGATMEAVVTRMKTVQSAVCREAGSAGMRLLAISASIPNVRDVSITIPSICLALIYT